MENCDMNYARTKEKILNIRWKKEEKKRLKKKIRKLKKKLKDLDSE